MLFFSRKLFLGCRKKIKRTQYLQENSMGFQLLKQVQYTSSVGGRRYYINVLCYRDNRCLKEIGFKLVRASGTRQVAHRMAAMRRDLKKIAAYIIHMKNNSTDKSLASKNWAKCSGYLREWNTSKILHSNWTCYSQSLKPFLKRMTSEKN